MALLQGLTPVCMCRPGCIYHHLGSDSWTGGLWGGHILQLVLRYRRAAHVRAYAFTFGATAHDRRWIAYGDTRGQELVRLALLRGFHYVIAAYRPTRWALGRC